MTRAAAGAAVVANDVYASAQAELRPLAAPAGEDPHRALQWGLARACAPRAWTVADGAGARVALLDSPPPTRRTATSPACASPRCREKRRRPARSTAR